MSGGGSSAKNDANFGEKILALFIVIVFAVIGGILIKMIRGIRLSKNFPFFPNKTIAGCCNTGICKKIVIPPLIGEIVLGAIARNFLPSDTMDKYDDSWAKYIRMMCLGIILLRGGMELEFNSLGPLVGFMTVIPPLVEGIIAALLANWWLDMKLELGLCLGAILGAVSPAVLVPCLMNLQMRGYGVEKGVPLSLLAASSFNDVFNITLFSVTSTIVYANAGVSDDSVGTVLLHILYEILGGIGSGIAIGLSMKIFTRFGHPFKAVLTLLITLAFVVVSEVIHAPEAKYIGIITYGYICFRWWGISGKPEHLLAQIWALCTPFLFGTIGAALKFDEVDTGVILPGIGIVIVSTIFRGIGAMFSGAISCKKFKFRELMFLFISWIPKATVQAALGGVILDFAKTEELDDYIKPGNQMLTVAVIAVILCAPTGAILTITFGQKWLDKKEKPEGQKYQKKYSKWDIVYIFFHDYHQRRIDQKKLGKDVKDIPFMLEEKERLKRMEDRETFLYQLKIYHAQTDNQLVLDEIERQREEFQKKYGAHLEFASAFSSLASSRENSRINKINKLNQQKNLEDIDVEKQVKSNQDLKTNPQVSNGALKEDQQQQQQQVVTGQPVDDIAYNDDIFADIQESTLQKQVITCIQSQIRDNNIQKQKQKVQ